ncbi:MAG: Holliday junction resolvase RuvX [Bacteroidota bacterium]
MAIDYGTKRVGLAVTDPSRIIATGLETVERKDVLDFIKKYHRLEGIERFVVGEPRNLDNTPSEIAPEVERFIVHLHTAFPGIPVDRVDERFTSKMAQRAIIDSGVRKQARRNKDLVDQTSAVLILQSWMAANGI